jgi:DNA modification methylase
LTASVGQHSEPRARIVWGNSSRMSLLGNGEARLILTSPPYFSETTEAHFLCSREQQTDFEGVSQQVTAYALSLRPVFEECVRILCEGGALVMQTKSLRYGEFLVPLADLHRQIAAQAGFRLVSITQWRSPFRRVQHRSGFERAPRTGNFRSSDPEQFCVFAHPCGVMPRERIGIEPGERARLASPLWEQRQTVSAAAHRHGAPRAVVARFIELFSLPDELVVDPFAGHGTTLIEAQRHGRRAVGYDIDPSCVARTEERLQSYTDPTRRKRPEICA